MRAFTPRHKLLGGVFGIVAVAWGIDLLTGQPGPSAAEAAASSAAIAAVPAPPPDPENLDRLIEALRADHTARASLPFDQVARDLFAPTPSMRAALEPPAPAVPTEPGAAETAAPGPIPFEAQHELQGTLTGRVPLALIDNVLCPRGALIDDYRLLRIHRDFVVLQRGRTRVILRITTAENR